MSAAVMGNMLKAVFSGMAKINAAGRPNEIINGDVFAALSMRSVVRGVKARVIFFHMSDATGQSRAIKEGQMMHVYKVLGVAPKGFAGTRIQLNYEELAQVFDDAPTHPFHKCTRGHHSQ
jgi:hypothetical protein